MDTKIETPITEKDASELQEMTSSSQPKQQTLIIYMKIILCAMIAFIIPFFCFISPKKNLREVKEEVEYRYGYETGRHEKLSEILADTNAVISEVKKAIKSIEMQEAFLLDVIERRKMRRTFTINGCEFTMIKVPGGSFYMGSNNGENNESPVHRVTLSDYYIGEFEVTQKLWKAVMGNNSSEHQNNTYPVTNVSYIECMEFVKRLNEKTGLPFSLPTEAQWEFAARGGNKTKGYKYSGSNTYSNVANCVEYSFWGEMFGYSNTPKTVGSKSANELGIYDMSGNVGEWCYDDYCLYESKSVIDPIGVKYGDNEETYGIARGGCYLSKPYECRLTYRNDLKFEYSLRTVGFRLALNE